MHYHGSMDVGLRGSPLTWIAGLGDYHGAWLCHGLRIAYVHGLRCNTSLMLPPLAHRKMCRSLGSFWEPQATQTPGP